ncbi:MAG: hypothetical protein ACP5I8_17620 [Phycisphaerae bacterium]
MKKQKNNQELFIVVNVWRGSPVGAEIFRSKATAVRRFNKLIEGNDLRENDVQIFTTVLKSGRACRSEQVVMDVQQCY